MVFRDEGEGSAFQNGIHGCHFFLCLINQLAAFQQLLGKIDVNAVDGLYRLIPDIVLQTGPEVHCQCPDLKLHRNQLFFVHKIHRNPYDDVQTAVAVGLWLFDIILDF